MDTWEKRILIIVTGLFWFSMYTYVPILALYAQRLGASYDMVGIIIGSYGLTQLLLRLPIGIVSDAWGKRKLFVSAGIILATVSGFGMWLFPMIGALLLFRALAGAAASTWVDYTVLYASYFSSNEAPKAIGFINAVNNFGQVAAMLLGGYIAEACGLPATFLLGALAGSAGIVISLFVREDQTKPKPLSLHNFIVAVHDRTLLKVSGLGVILQIGTYVTVFGFLPLAAQRLGASHFEMGLLTAITMVPSIFSSAMSGAFFSRHFGEKATLVSGLLLVAISYLIIPFAPNLFLLYISQAIGGFARGLALPLLMGMSIRHFAEDKRSTAMGLFQAVYGFGMLGGPVLAGMLNAFWGLNAGFLAAGVIGLFGASLAAWRGYLPQLKKTGIKP